MRVIVQGLPWGRSIWTGLTEDYQRSFAQTKARPTAISWPIRLVLRHADARITALCCARAASGHAKAEPATALPPKG
jgi:hypothetical protein